MPRRHIDFDAVRELGLELPDVVDASTHRGMALKLGGRLLACRAIHKSAEPNSLMVRIGHGERERLLAENPRAFYLTEHYRKAAAILVRLDRVSLTALRRMLERGWRHLMEKG
jgi:hypothetical protein